MNKNPRDANSASADLRKRAEEIFQKNASLLLPEQFEAVTSEEARHLLHELAIHQIELEMQNEELRQAYVEIEAARAHYFNLYDLAPVGYIAVDQKGRIRDSNLTAATLLGVGRAALANKQISHFIFMEDEESYLRLLKKLLHTNNPEESEAPLLCDLRMVKSDGSPFWAHWVVAAAQDESGEPTLHIVLSDITDFKRSEEKIVQLSQAVEQSPVLVIITNRAGDIEYVNPKFCAVTGYAREEVIGRNPRILKSGEKSQGDYKELWATIMAGKEWRGEFHNRKKCGELYWESASISPIRNAAGHIDHFLAVKEDITDRKQAEKDLLEKNAEIERFTYTVSHDLKSPLVTIKTFLGYLEEDLHAKNTEAADKDMAYIHGAADKMGFLLSELLELARISHKKNPPGFVPMQTVVQEALLLVAGQIAQRDVHVDVTTEPIMLYGDHPRLVAVFENLVDNAVKFLGDQPAPRVEIGMETSDGEIVLFVRDNGQGVDPRHQAKLFGLFEKLDPHTPGSGMGLAMVRRIIEMHGGKIWLESEGLGHGATFRFTLANTQLKI